MQETSTPLNISGEGEGVPELDLERVLRVLRRRWAIIVACTLILGAAAFGYTQLQTKQYTATASVLFGDTGIQQQASGLSGQPSTDPNVASATNVLLLRLGPTAAATAREIGHGLTEKQVSDVISVAPQGQSDIVSVAATSPSPRLANRIANDFVQQFIAARTKADVQTITQARNLVQGQYSSLSPLQRHGALGQALADRAESLRVLASLQTGDVQLVQAAGIPTSPSSPKVALDTLAGLAAGLLLGVILAFVLERLDRRLHKLDDIEEAFGFSVLGHIQEAPAFAKPRFDAGEPLRLPHEAEAFRMLRAHLRYYNVDRDIRTILVTSISPGDGKTTIAHNLAEAAASMGTSTLLVEADLRRPQLSKHYGIKGAPGLSDVLISHDIVDKAIQQVSIAGLRTNGTHTEAALDVLVAGPPPPNPSELLESTAMQNLLDWAATQYELVIIDAPPAAVVSDAIPLVARVSGVLVVSRLGRNTRDSARRFQKTLKSLGAPVLGVIVNGINPRRDYGYGYGYGYGYDGYYSVALSNGKEPDEAVAEETVGAKH